MLPKLKLGVAGLGRAFAVMLPAFVRDPRIARTDDHIDFRPHAEVVEVDARLDREAGADEQPPIVAHQVGSQRQRLVAELQRSDDRMLQALADGGELGTTDVALGEPSGFNPLALADSPVNRAFLSLAASTVTPPTASPPWRRG